jgi:hypothetical protein
MADARAFLTTLVGKPLRTITHNNSNTVLGLEGDSVRVRTDDSGDEGALVPIRYVQQGMDALYRDGELRINKATLGHRRTAFIGAALRELQNVEVVVPSQRLRVSSDDPNSTPVIANPCDAG